MGVAAVVLGVIGGLIAVLFGFFGSALVGAVGGPGSFIPLLIGLAGLIGGAMAIANPVVGGGLMAASAFGILVVFGLNVVTVLPAALLLAGALFAFMSKQGVKAVSSPNT